MTSDSQIIELARDHAREVAAEHDLTVDLSLVDWSVSGRMKRAAGKCMTSYRNRSHPQYDEQFGHIRSQEIRLSRKHFEAADREEWLGTVRHELAHAVAIQKHGKIANGHGFYFEQLRQKLDATRHCQKFVEPDYVVYCTEDGCDEEYARYQRSKVVKYPERYACGACDGDLAVETNPDGGRVITADD